MKELYGPKRRTRCLEWKTESQRSIKELGTEKLWSQRSKIVLGIVELYEPQRSTKVLDIEDLCGLL